MRCRPLLTQTKSVRLRFLTHRTSCSRTSGISIKNLGVTTPSLKIDSPLQLTTVETIGLVFRGEALELLMVVEGEDLPKAIQTSDHLVKKLTTLQNLTLVVLNPRPRKLIDPDGLQSMSEFPWNVSHIRLTDRRVTSIKQSNDRIAWILVSAGESRNSAKQPRFKALPLMEFGRTTDQHIFSDPQAPSDLYAIHAHTRWLPKLYEHLQTNKKAADESAGNNGRTTKIIHFRMDERVINSVV